MMTSSECRKKACDLNELAELSINVTIRDDYLAMATRWLSLAAVADYQDGISVRGKPDIPH